MSQDLWRELGEWAFYGVAISSLVFVVLFAIFSPWWRTNTGRNIMAVMGSLSATTSYFTFAYWLEQIPVLFYEIRFILLLTMTVAIVWRIHIFLKVQLMSHRDQRKKGVYR